MTVPRFVGRSIEWLAAIAVMAALRVAMMAVLSAIPSGSTVPEVVTVALGGGYTLTMDALPADACHSLATAATHDSTLLSASCL